MPNGDRDLSEEEEQCDDTSRADAGGDVCMGLRGQPNLKKPEPPPGDWLIDPDHAFFENENPANILINNT